VFSLKNRGKEIKQLPPCAVMTAPSINLR